MSLNASYRQDYLGDADTSQVQSGSLALTGAWLSIPFDDPRVFGYPNQRLFDSAFPLEDLYDLGLPVLDDPDVKHKVSFDVDEELPTYGFCIPILAREHIMGNSALMWQVRA